MLDEYSVLLAQSVTLRGPTSVSSGGAATLARRCWAAPSASVPSRWMFGDEMKVAFRAWAGSGGRGPVARLRVVVDPDGGTNKCRRSQIADGLFSDYSRFIYPWNSNFHPLCKLKVVA